MHFSGLKMRRIQVWQYRLTASLGETPYYSVIDIDYTFGHEKRAEQPQVLLELV